MRHMLRLLHVYKIIRSTARLASYTHMRVQCRLCAYICVYWSTTQTFGIVVLGMLDARTLPTSRFSPAASAAFTSSLATMSYLDNRQSVRHASKSTNILLHR